MSLAAGRRRPGRSFKLSQVKLSQADGARPGQSDEDFSKLGLVASLTPLSRGGPYLIWLVGLGITPFHGHACKFVHVWFRVLPSGWLVPPVLSSAQAFLVLVLAVVLAAVLTVGVRPIVRARRGYNLLLSPLHRPSQERRRGATALEPSDTSGEPFPTTPSTTSLASILWPAHGAVVVSFNSAITVASEGQRFLKPSQCRLGVTRPNKMRRKVNLLTSFFSPGV